MSLTPKVMVKKRPIAKTKYGNLELTEKRQVTELNTGS